MNKKLLNCTNQELLKALEQRLPNFTQDEFMILIRLFNKYEQEFMKIFQVMNPSAHQ
jgi:hypothetical protein